MLFASTTKGFLCLAVVTGLANTAHAQQSYCDGLFSPDGSTTAATGFYDYDLGFYSFDTIANCEAVFEADRILVIPPSNSENFQNCKTYAHSDDTFAEVYQYRVYGPDDKNAADPLVCVAAGVPTAAPTAAPTPAPTPSFEWQQERGCCREKVGKSLYNHHATVSDVQVFSQSARDEADLNCTATCAGDTACTAIELTVKKGTARCEFHTSAINAATRGSKSCKQAQCKYKTAYMAATAAPVPGPSESGSPTSAPTAVPTPEPAWTEKKGCCRQVDGKIKYSHHGTATTTIIRATSFSAAAVECKEQCNDNENCTAAEVRQQRKKGTTVYKCELHSDTINSSTRGSKSCKKATCSIKN